MNVFDVNYGDTGLMQLGRDFQRRSCAYAWYLAASCCASSRP